MSNNWRIEYTYNDKLSYYLYRSGGEMPDILDDSREDANGDDHRLINEYVNELELFKERAGTLFGSIAHGDTQHKVWLEAAIKAHFAGEPMPEIVLSERDARMAELERENTEMKSTLTYLEVQTTKLLNLIDQAEALVKGGRRGV